MSVQAGSRYANTWRAIAYTERPERGKKIEEPFSLGQVVDPVLLAPTAFLPPLTTNLVPATGPAALSA